MKVSTSSWHFRAINHLDWDHPSSLCPYFWKALFATFCLFVLSCTAGLILGCMVTVPMLYVTSLIIDGPSIFEDGAPYLGFVLVGSVVWGFITGFITACLCLAANEYRKSTESYIKRQLEKEIAKEKARNKPESLLGAFIKVAYQKVCPRIEFERE